MLGARKIFLRFLLPNPAFGGGQLWPENKLIKGQPNEYDVICRNSSVLAFHLWPTIFLLERRSGSRIFAGTAFHQLSVLYTAFDPSVLHTDTAVSQISLLISTASWPRRSLLLFSTKEIAQQLEHNRLSPLCAICCCCIQ